MDILEGQRRLAALNSQLQHGYITREQFSAGANQIRAQDSHGTWWQPDPGGRGWIFWDGTAWKPGIPPGSANVPVQPPATPESRPAGAGGTGEGMMDLKTFRQMSRDVPLAKRPQKWWDLLSIIGGVVAAVVWIIYSGMSPTGGGTDLLTVILMIAVPVALVMFRTPIDGLLLPIQPTRKKVPKLVLVGAGIVIPFLTAFILYNIFHIGNYPLIQANLIFGTLCSYILVRDPVLATGRQPPGNSGRPTLALLVILIPLLIIPVLADDCARDPTDAEDCLRTPGFAELISGTAAAGLAILVNGPIIIQTVAAGSGGGVSAGAGTGTGTTGGTGVPPPGPSSGPRDGETRTIRDYRGQDMDITYDGSTGKWMTGHGTEIDLSRVDDARRQYQSDRDWSAKEHEYIRSKSEAEAAKSFEPPPPPTKSEDTKKFEKWFKEYLKTAQEHDIKNAQTYTDQANLWDNMTKGAELTEKAADIGVDVLSNVTGPVGKNIKTAYKVTKAMGKNISKSYAEGGSLLEGAGKGALEAGFEVGFDKLKDKGLEKLSKTVPMKFRPLVNPKSGDVSNMSPKEIINLIEKSGSGKYVISKTTTEQLGKAVFGATYKTAHGQAIKYTIKDPLKKYVGLK